jgi:hypothetical protein
MLAWPLVALAIAIGAFVIAWRWLRLQESETATGAELADQVAALRLTGEAIEGIRAVLATMDDRVRMLEALQPPNDDKPRRSAGPLWARP